jgi:acylphosphatase
MCSGTVGSRFYKNLVTGNMLRCRCCRRSNGNYVHSDSNKWFSQSPFLHLVAILPESFDKVYTTRFPQGYVMERITAIARGRVQGVGYRHFIAGCAQATGVRGYVKNLPDGSVEMVAESSPASLADFIRFAHARDNPVIQVEKIAVTPGPATGEYRGFQVEW